MRRNFLSTFRELLLAPPRGVSAVEFGLAAPFLILLLVALTDLGLGFYDSLQVQGAASAGAQYASTHAWNTANITAAVQAATDLRTQVTMQGGSPSTVCVCTDNDTFTIKGAAELQSGTSFGDCNNIAANCPNGNRPALHASVGVQFSYNTLLPYPWATGTVTLTGQAFRRLQ